jgi:hypothetical protein
MENLRYERQLTQDEYLHGIVPHGDTSATETMSPRRHLRRFLVCPKELASRSSDCFHIMHEEDHRLEATRIQDYFNLIIQKKTEEANHLEHFHQTIRDDLGVDSLDH